MPRERVPQRVRAMFRADPRIVEVREYQDGWVPRSYRWDAPGRVVWYHRRRRNRHIYRAGEGTYDRKRSYADGPRLVAFSARGGRLASA